MIFFASARHSTSLHIQLCSNIFHHFIPLCSSNRMEKEYKRFNRKKRICREKGENRFFGAKHGFPSFYDVYALFRPGRKILLVLKSSFNNKLLFIEFWFDFFFVPPSFLVEIRARNIMHDWFDCETFSPFFLLLCRRLKVCWRRMRWDLMAHDDQICFGLLLLLSKGGENDLISP